VVLVRSIMLRGFDRDLVDKIQKYMESEGTRTVLGSLPTSIEKLANGRLLVKYTNGGEEGEEFDTVVAAVGRYADCEKLGLDTVGVHVSKKSGKVICKNEQTNIPHIYGIGDAVEGVPELTPVAVMSGRMLAKR
jgi:pyruvate/2-oxoglutarate dehydrogenase complex dihydrolipoamide dehydrogenase (E3) component